MEVYAILFFEAKADTIIRKGNDIKRISAGQIEQVTSEKWADNIEAAKVEALAELQELVCEGMGTWYVGVFEADPEGDDSELLWESIPVDDAKGANTMSNLKNTLVYSFLDKRDVFALRQNNQTLLIPFSRKIADSDRAILTDKYGHRYSRDISLEQFSSHMVFTMI